MPNQRRFHIQLDQSRTTISVDEELFELMVFNLGYTPDDESAHGIVREWLQDNIISSLGDDAGRKNASQWARIYLIREIAKPRLIRKVDAWQYDYG
jgi:hypothetical protein